MTANYSHLFSIKLASLLNRLESLGVTERLAQCNEVSRPAPLV